MLYTSPGVPLLSTAQMASQWSSTLKPVADVHAVAVEGDFFALDQVGDEQRDEFSGNW